MTGTRGREEAAARLRERVDELAAACVELQYRRDASLEARYGVEGRRRCREDAAHHLRHLAEAVALGAPGMFRDYVLWGRELLAGLGIPAADLEAQLRLLGDVIRAELPAAEADAVAACLGAGAAALDGPEPRTPSHLAGEDELAGLARGYLDELLRFRHGPANARLLAAVEDGLAIEPLYLRVLQPVLREVGRLWQTGRITVANEHYCTAATQGVMSRLYPRIFDVEPSGRQLVAACIGEELHEIGVRMVADLAALRGWDATYLGANVPLASIVRTVEERRAHVLAVSTTIVAHLAPVERLLEALREHRAAGLRVLVGGHPFLGNAELCRSLGADGSAEDAAGAVALAEELAA